MKSWSGTEKKKHAKKWSGNFRSDWTDRSKRTTSGGGPLLPANFHLGRTVPFMFGPKFPQILVQWKAPDVLHPGVFRAVFSTAKSTPGSRRFASSLLNLTGLPFSLMRRKPLTFQQFCCTVFAPVVLGTKRYEFDALVCRVELIFEFAEKTPRSGSALRRRRIKMLKPIIQTGVSQEFQGYV